MRYRIKRISIGKTTYYVVEIKRLLFFWSWIWIEFVSFLEAEEYIVLQKSYKEEIARTYN